MTGKIESKKENGGYNVTAYLPNGMILGYYRVKEISNGFWVIYMQDNDLREHGVFHWFSHSSGVSKKECMNWILNETYQFTK